MIDVGSHIPNVGRWIIQQGERVEVPTWQALDVRDKPQGATIELQDVCFTYDIPVTPSSLKLTIKPSDPWAENQFKERVAGPANPGETFKEWPWYHGNVEQHKEQGRFSHTYMDRYWPNGEVNPPAHLAANGQLAVMAPGSFGNLDDVVNLLANEPTTRQAYLPVWFPFDTGAVHHERVPCSLGYLFLMRENKLNITYYIRSCDFIRHFRDDVYMTARLCQWMKQEVANRIAGDEPMQATNEWDHIKPGRLTMHIGSLHVFEGDLPKLRREYGE